MEAEDERLHAESKAANLRAALARVNGELEAVTEERDAGTRRAKRAEYELTKTRQRCWDIERSAEAATAAELRRERDEALERVAAFEREAEDQAREAFAATPEQTDPCVDAIIPDLCVVVTALVEEAFRGADIEASVSDSVAKSITAISLGRFYRST
jgi:chromosome segregation ATPase